VRARIWRARRRSRGFHAKRARAMGGVEFCVRTQRGFAV